MYAVFHLPGIFKSTIMIKYRQHILLNTASKQVIILKEDNTIFTLLSETGNIYKVSVAKLKEQILDEQYKVQTDLFIADFLSEHPEFIPTIEYEIAREGHKITVPIHNYFNESGQPQPKKENKLLLLLIK